MNCAKPTLFKKPFYSYPDVNYLEVCLLGDRFDYLPDKYKDRNTYGNIGKDEIYMSIPTEICRGWASSVKLSAVDQGNRLGMDGRYFYINVYASQCLPNIGDVIEVKDFKLYIVNNKPII